MTTKTTYIANDGTEFTNREECQAHEYYTIKANTKAKLFNQYGAVAKSASDTIYAILPNAEALDDFQWLCYQEKVFSPDDIGEWHWDEQEDKFVPLEEYEDKLKYELSVIEQIRGQINE